MSTREAEFLKVRVLFSFLQVEYDDTGNVYFVQGRVSPINTTPVVFSFLFSL